MVETNKHTKAGCITNAPGFFNALPIQRYQPPKVISLTTCFHLNTTHYHESRPHKHNGQVANTRPFSFFYYTHYEKTKTKSALRVLFSAGRRGLMS